MLNEISNFHPSFGLNILNFFSVESKSKGCLNGVRCSSGPFFLSIYSCGNNTDKALSSFK